MFNAGMRKPGSTIRIPVNTFDSNDPSASVTATNWANTDCHVHKDGSTTQRASSSGETLSLNYDTITGNHLLEIDTSDNTTAGFYAAGSHYDVRIEGVTVDAGTINAWIGSFDLGYEDAILNTTIATLASQTSFTLTAGPADNDALNGCSVLVHDVASAVQIAIGYVSDYTGATKTVTLAADPGIFTMAATDNISFFMPAQVGSWNLVPLATTNPLPNAAADAAGGLPISDAGGLDLDTQLAATNEVTSARMGALTDWIDGGRLDLLLDAIKVVTDAIGTTGTGLSAIPWNASWDAEVQSEVNDGLVAFFTSVATLVDLIFDEPIAGHTTAKTWGAMLNSIQFGTVDNTAFTATTTILESDDITEATADHYIGRTLIFLSDAVRYQATDITDYAVNGGRGRFTYTALTDAPSDNTQFVVV